MYSNKLDKFGIPIELSESVNPDKIGQSWVKNRSSVKSSKALNSGEKSGLRKLSTRKSISENTLKSLDTTLFWRLVRSTEQKSSFSPNLKVLQAIQSHNGDVVTFKFWVDDNGSEKTVRFAITAGGLTSVPEEIIPILENFCVFVLPVESGLNEDQAQHAETLPSSFDTKVPYAKAAAVYSKSDDLDEKIKALKWMLHLRTNRKWDDAMFRRLEKHFPDKKEFMHNLRGYLDDFESMDAPIAEKKQ